MCNSARRIISYLAIAMALLFVPSLSQAGVVVIGHGAFAQPNFQYGPVRFRPKAMLLKVHLLKSTVANYENIQKGNTKNHFSGIIGCAIHPLNRPHVDQDREEGTVFFPKQNLPIGTSFLCTVTVLGEGGVTGTMPIYATIVL